MLIEYYKSNDLAYANRKRYKTFNYVADASETQRAVKLGDGATTSIKTSASNICNYVIITQTADDNTIIQKTRWYVTYYIYLNGGQVELFLQRDVIGENGLNGLFGKVERGYTETFLRNRKELSLNQRLINRIPLISSDEVYGNYEINNHTEEKWGIIYLTKPTKIDPQTGQAYAYSDTPTINVPAFTPKDCGYTVIANNTTYVIGYSNSTSFDMMWFNIYITNTSKYYRVLAYINCPNSNNLSWSIKEIFLDSIESTNEYISITTNGTYSEQSLRDYLMKEVILNVILTEPTVWKKVSNSIPEEDYDNKCIKNPNNPSQFFRYTVTENSSGVNISSNTLITRLVAMMNSSYFSLDILTAVSVNAVGNYYSNIDIKEDLYTYVVLSGNQAGEITLDVDVALVDEPYICYAFPLYGVTITNKKDNTETYTINQTDAFSVFNSIVEACSGENSYLVDAQIYPYGPDITDVAVCFETNDNKKFPFFNVAGTSFTRNVEIDVNPYNDVKKEYIKRDYYIVSPEQSANTHFNFYDYYLEKQNVEFTIKTALKPMNIIASAVIIPNDDSLKGITYKSDLRGCRPTSNGFECSISTNKFQEYIRNNSNYQAIFALQKEELQKQHEVERVNENASIVMNTISATMMGAIGGGALADVQVFGTKASAAGAIAGATVAGATVGTEMQKQREVNNQLRDYEESLLQQRFDLQIGTIKNIPNTVSRISSFNEIIMKDFYFVVEVYECSNLESEIADTFIEKYSYGIGIFGRYEDFERDKWFLRGTVITSNLVPNQHIIAQKELNGGIYYYE